MFRAFIRASAFWGKEVFAILRQPQLIVSLILGPFLILLLFGIGLRIEPRALRVLFVTQENSVSAEQIKQYATSLGPQLIFAGITGDLEDAQAKLRRGEVEVVAVVPSNPTQTINNNQQAMFTLYHREIDPTQISYIEIFGHVYIDEINRRILQADIVQAQNHVTEFQANIRTARTEAAAVRDALQRGDTASAKQHQQALAMQINTLASTMTVGALVFGMQSTADANGSNQDSITSLLDDLRKNATNGDASAGNAADTAAKIDSDLEKLSVRLDQFKKIDPAVAISPFSSEIKSVSPVPLKSADYFATSALALILQHLALTFAALSIVQERRMGTLELFRVSPLSTVETLFGKYLSFAVFTSIIGAVLCGLIVYGLQVPMLGNWVNLALAIFLLIFTSLGLGFVISLISQSDSQAIQYAMLALLASVFFSGAFISLDSLILPVRTVSWAMPATYGIVLFQDIMLRGFAPNPILLGALGAMGLFLYLVAWALLHRTLATR
jgi:ABC-2 type transport system permease protein